MEGLWISAVLLVPIVFLGQDYSISEAQIAYVEVPKVALLRSLAALMAILWLSEWSIKSRAFESWAFEGLFPSIHLNSIQFNTLAEKLRPWKLVSDLRDWLKVHPTRWFLLAAALFFGSTFLSTVLSGSFSTSVWGEIPGQDGYSAYTIASYGILFGAIATHLRSRAQIGRLLGTVVFMGVLVGLYGILQHYSHDFLNITETTGGGSGRVTVFMGNAILAGAVLSMTLPVTLVLAAISFHDERLRDWGPFSRLGRLAKDHIFTSVWALLLSIQLLGLMFTFSRGPWGGAVLALVVFLGLVALSLGWRSLLRIALVLGLAGIFSASFLHWNGSVSVISLGSWLGVVLALLGLASVYATLFIVERFARSLALLIAVGAAVTIVGAAVLGPSALSGRVADTIVGASAADISTAGQVGARISSIKTEVLDGFVGGRGTHWKVSWELIRNRPWFAFDNLSLAWLRPLIGYGPDLFRYTYLLESQPESSNLAPLEPDHAHNFFIHQTVEQGLFGGIAALALFASVFGVAVHHILRRRQSGNPFYRLLLIGLMAIIFGRFLEMMVGVARISDLTVLWVIFGLFAALMSFDDGHGEEGVPPAQEGGRRRRRRQARASVKQSFSTGMFIRLAVVAWLVGGIGVITWQKSINSVRASVAEGRALDNFRRGDFAGTVEELDKAIKLSPGVPSYYNNRAQIFVVYQIQFENVTEPVCNQQDEVPYLVCLGLQSLGSNQDSIDQQPYNYRAMLATANSAFNLQLYDLALEYYANAADMVPNSWKIRNDLAESQINAGFYSDALAELDRSLGITGDRGESTAALFLKGRALQELGRLDEAVESLQIGSVTPQSSLDLMRDIYTEQGVRTDIGYFDQVIEQDPTDAFAYYFRGLARLSTGDAEGAISDMDVSISLGIALSGARATRGYAHFKAGNLNESSVDLDAVLRVDPQSALANAYYGEIQSFNGNLESGLSYLEKANLLNPKIGVAHLIRAEILFSLGLEEETKKALDLSAGLDLPTFVHYIDRADIYTSLGNHELASSDISEAIKINPKQALPYSARAKAHAKSKDFMSAIDDFKTAILLEPGNSEYRVRIALAEAQIDAGSYDEAIHSLNQSIDIFGTRGESIEVLNFDANTLREMAMLEEAVDTFKGAILLAPKSSIGQSALDQIREIYTEQGIRTDITYFDGIIDQDSEDVFAYYFRGVARLAKGDAEGAILDIDKSINLLGMTMNEMRATRGYAEFKAGLILAQYFPRLEAVLSSDPQNALANAYFGEFQTLVGNPEGGLSYLERASLQDPDLGIAHLVRAEIYMSLGLEEEAKKALDSSAGLDLPTFVHYIDRADIYASFDNQELALLDISEAIRINPNQALPYGARAKIHAESNDFESAIDDFTTAILLDPANSEYRVRIALAEAQIDADSYDETLRELNQSLGRIGNSGESIEALSINAKTLQELGLLEEAVEFFKNFDLLAPNSKFAKSSLDMIEGQLLRDIYTEQGVRTVIGHFDGLIELDSSDAFAYYFRGLARLAKGDAEGAIRDIDESINLGIAMSEALANRGYAKFKAGHINGPYLPDVEAVLRSEPDNALANAYFGEFQTFVGNPEGGLSYLEKSSLQDPDLGIAHLIRAEILISSGQTESAKVILGSRGGLELPTADHYVKRGEIFAFFGDYDLAFSDLDEAIRINPDQAKYYNARAKIHASRSNLEIAVGDFNAAIEIDPADAEYFINRGVVYDMLGEAERSLADFETAKTLGEVDIPQPDDRNPSYFAFYNQLAADSG